MEEDTTPSGLWRIGIREVVTASRYLIRDSFSLSLPLQQLQGIDKLKVCRTLESKVVSPCACLRTPNVEGSMPRWLGTFPVLLDVKALRFSTPKAGGELGCVLR